MKLLDILKENPIKTWRWVAIILFVLLTLQTCSKCSSKQNQAFSDKSNSILIDSLKGVNSRLQDSVLILNGEIQSLQQNIQNLEQENSHVRDALKQSQAKPVIIYRETMK